MDEVKQALGIGRIVSVWVDSVNGWRPAIVTNLPVRAGMREGDPVRLDVVVFGSSYAPAHAMLAVEEQRCETPTERCWRWPPRFSATRS